MTVDEALHVLLRVGDILHAIGERPLACRMASDPCEERYAVFSAGADPVTGVHVEQLVAYANGVPLMFDDLPAEEIAVHEARHVLQYRLGIASCLTADSIYANALMCTGFDDRIPDFFEHAAHEAGGDILELDAMIVAILVCRFDCPLDVIAWQ